MFRSSKVFSYNIKYEEKTLQKSVKTDTVANYLPGAAAAASYFLPEPARTSVGLAAAAYKFYEQLYRTKMPGTKRGRHGRSTVIQRVKAARVPGGPGYLPITAGKYSRKRKMGGSRRSTKTYRGKGRMRRTRSTGGRVLRRSGYRRRYGGRSKRKATKPLRAATARAVRKEVGDCYNQLVADEQVMISPLKQDVDYTKTDEPYAPFIFRMTQAFNSKCDWLPTLYHTSDSSQRAANMHYYPERCTIEFTFHNPATYPVYLKVDKLQYRQSKHHVEMNPAVYQSPVTIIGDLAAGDNFWGQTTRQNCGASLFDTDNVLALNYMGQTDPGYVNPTSSRDSASPFANINKWEWWRSTMPNMTQFSTPLGFIFPLLRKEFKISKYIRMKVPPGGTRTVRKTFTKESMIPWLAYQDSHEWPVVSKHTFALFWRQYTMPCGTYTYPLDQTTYKDDFMFKPPPAGLIATKRVTIRWRASGDQKPSFYYSRHTVTPGHALTKPFDLLADIANASAIDMSFDKSKQIGWSINMNTHTGVRPVVTNGGRVG